MSDNNTINVPKNDLLNWARSAKVTHGNILDVFPDDDGIRFHKGSEVYGVVVEKDSRNIDELWERIAEFGGIHTPLLVSERADGKRISIQGNTRTAAAHKGLSDPQVNPVLKENLTKKCPMIVLKGLSREQEIELAQDQTQKPFMRSEMIRHVFNQLRMGRTYEFVVNANWEQFAKMFSTDKLQKEKRAKYDALLSRAEKDKFLKQWFRGSVDGYIVTAFRMGEWMRKQVMLSEMLIDGLLPDTAVRPYFKTDHNNQKRFVALKTAMDKDGAKFNPLIPLEVENSEFTALLRQYHAEDFPDPNAPVKEKTPTGILSKADVELLRTQVYSSLSRSVIDRVLKCPVPDLNELDDYALAIQTKKMLADQHIARLHPTVAACVRFCLFNPDTTDFKNFLEANQMKEENVPSGTTDTFSLNPETENAS